MNGREFEKVMLTTDVLPSIKRSGGGEVRPGRAKSTKSPSVRSKRPVGLLRILQRITRAMQMGFSKTQGDVDAH
jgi:hypothetical protein